jgi:ABC-type polysaccharide/polyol phosphate export permease
MVKFVRMISKLKKQPNSYIPLDHEVQNVIDSDSYSSFIGYLKKITREIYGARFAWFYFVRNALRYRYRRSNLGFLWNLLNPLLTMTVMAIAFSAVFNRDINVYIIYLFSGSAPYQFLSLSIQHATQSMVSYEGYLKKIYLPKPFFPLVSVSIEAINFLFSLCSMLIIALIIGAKFSSTILLLPLAIIILFLFNLGVGMILSVAFVYFRDLSNIISVFFTAMFYMTPILYPEENVPANLAFLFKLNPLSYFVLLVRRLILGDRPVTISDWAIPLAGALIMFLIGLFVMMKKDREVVYRL